LLRSPELTPELTPHPPLLATGLERASSRDSGQRWALVASDIAALALTYVLLRFVIAPHDTRFDAALIAALPVGWWSTRSWVVTTAVSTCCTSPR